LDYYLYYFYFIKHKKILGMTYDFKIILIHEKIQRRMIYDKANAEAHGTVRS